METTTVPDGKKRTPIDVSQVPGAIPPQITIDDDPNVEGLRRAMAAAEGDDPDAPPGSITSHMPASAPAPAPIAEDGPSENDPGPGPVEEVLEDDPPPALQAEADENDPEEILEPRILPIPRTLTDNYVKDGVPSPRSATYVQKGLGFFGKMELYGIFGRLIDSLTSGEDGLDIGDIMAATRPKELLEMFNSNYGLPGAETSPDAEDETENVIDTRQLGIEKASQVLTTFARLLSLAGEDVGPGQPSMLKQVYAVILGIPKGHRKWAYEWALDNMDDEMGEDILHTFVDQNWPVMEDFYRRRLPQLLRRGKQARRRFQSGRSKP